MLRSPKYNSRIPEMFTNFRFWFESSMWKLEMTLISNQNTHHSTFQSTNIYLNPSRLFLRVWLWNFWISAVGDGWTQFCSSFLDAGWTLPPHLLNFPWSFIVSSFRELNTDTKKKKIQECYYFTGMSPGKFRLAKGSKWEHGSPKIDWFKLLEKPARLYMPTETSR